MPAYSTHYIFAKELKEEIENCVEFKLNDAALFIGTQGPDIFFDHRVMPWMIGKSMRKIGSLLHRAKPSDIFDKMREYINLSESKDIANLMPQGLYSTMHSIETVTHMYMPFKTKWLKNIRTSTATRRTIRLSFQWTLIF